MPTQDNCSDIRQGRQKDRLMLRIFDNIEQHFRPALAETIEVSDRADFCVGYFNLRGWRSIDEFVEKWQGGDGHCCRLPVGIQHFPGKIVA